MGETVRINLYVGTGFAGCSHKDVYEMPREEWQAMSKEEKEKLLDDLAVEFRNNVIDCSAWAED